MKKRSKKSQAPIVAPEYPFRILGVDSSFKRPGFALLSVLSKDEIRLLERYNLNNATLHKDALRGEVLMRNAAAINLFAQDKTIAFFVREAAINARGGQSEIPIFETVGLLDYLLYMQQQKAWHEIYPVSVKKILTGSAKSSKQQVADLLTNYVGHQDYECDDESDAVAVAIAWLIQQNLFTSKLKEDKA